MTRLRIILEFVVLILTIAVCGAMLLLIGRTWRVPVGAIQPSRTAARNQAGNPDKLIPTDPAPLDGAQLEGNRDATVAVIEYSDFQCPYCGRFATQTFPAFEKQYVQSGQVLFAFRQFPLESIHPYALKAAEAAECAGDQGHFWPMHALTFADQSHLDDAALHERAATAGVDLQRFDKCLNGDVANRVRSDELAGKRMVVAGTPTFFFGTLQADGRVKVVKRLSGAVPFDQFKATIDTVMSSQFVAHKDR